MIKTLLINPPYSLEERYGRSMKSFGAVTEPMGLAYLAAALEKNGFIVEILDAPATNLGVDDIVKKIHAEHFQLIGITLLTPMFEAVRNLVSKIRLSSRDVKIIVGGPHASALPEGTLEEIQEIDFLCIGEGEGTIVDVANCLMGKVKPSDILGMAYRQDGRILRNDERPFLKNLDDLSKPARHLLPMDRYQLTASRTKGSAFCPTVIVARGCPFDCQYCSHPFGRTFRHHSVERIVEELWDLKRSFGVNQVNLEADTLTLDRNFVRKLCQSIIDERLDLQWTCESRIDTVDEEMLLLMKKAGCWQISYGVESGSQRLLDYIHKGVRLEKVLNTFAVTKKAGISIRGFFMLGLPGETKSETLETVRFAKQLDPLWAQFTITIPYPGTPMFNELAQQGSLRHYQWEHYNTWGGWAGRQLPYVPEGRTEEEIKELQKKAMRMYYLRPVIFFRFLKTISSLKDIIKYVKGLFVLINTVLRKKDIHHA